MANEIGIADIVGNYLLLELFFIGIINILWP